jgi:hypothetical protein
MLKSVRATDWTAYYEGSFVASRLTRRYTTRVLIDSIRNYSDRTDQALRVAEIGGGNSCFLEAMRKHIPLAEYHVYDTNQFGLELLAKRSDDSVCLHQEDVLTIEGPSDFDVVVSVGLVEHFDVGGTRTAIENHFKLAQAGALVILSFPTPTALYRATRGLAEVTKQWKFPDERPLRINEVEDTMSLHGEILHVEILWPLVLTQALIVARKR